MITEQKNIDNSCYRGVAGDVQRLPSFQGLSAKKSNNVALKWFVVIVVLLVMSEGCLRFKVCLQKI